MYFIAFAWSWELFENADFTLARLQGATLIQSKQPSLAII